MPTLFSPLLANVALTTLDKFCQRFGWQYKAEGKTHNVNPIVRYADDFVIVCQTESEAKSIKNQISKHLCERVGVQLSDDKTHITHIAKGFNFLGFHFRKYSRYNRSQKPKRQKASWRDYLLLIKPQPEKVLNCKSKIKSVLKRNKTTKQSAVIHQLNAILRGWGNYYRHVVSKEVYRTIDYDTFWKCLRWALRRHPNKSKQWVINKYFSRKGRWKLAFADREEKRRPSCVKLSEIPIRRHWKVSWKYRVYDGSKQAIEYWHRRDYFKALDALSDESVQERLFRRQKGQCGMCHTPLSSAETNHEEYETHHLFPQQFGRTHQLRNLRLVHTECHRMIHRLFSTKQMAELTDKGIDYLRLLKGRRTAEEGESVAR